MKEVFGKSTDCSKSLQGRIFLCKNSPIVLRHITVLFHLTIFVLSFSIYRNLHLFFSPDNGVTSTEREEDFCPKFRLPLLSVRLRDGDLNSSSIEESRNRFPLPDQQFGTC